MRLLPKGLFLIGAILACQFAFMAILTWQLVMVDRQLWLELRKFQCIAAGNRVVEQFYKAAKSLLQYGILRDEEALSRYAEHHSDLKRYGEFTWMMIETNPASSLRIIKASYVLSDKATTALEQLKLAFDHGLAPMSKADPLRKHYTTNTTLFWTLKDTLREYFEQMLDLASIEHQGLNQARQEGFARRKVVRQLLVGGFVLYALLAIGATIFWIRGVSRRFDQLAVNASLLERGQELPSVIEKGDEIGELELALVDAANKLRTADHQRREIVAVISHEVRSPLTAIGAAITMLEDGILGEPNEEGSREFRAAQLESKRLLNLINELLYVSKMETGAIGLAIEKVSVNELIEVALDEAGEILEENGVKVRVDAQTHVLFTDPSRLEQVLTKLFGSIASMSPPDSTLTVTCMRKREMLELRIECQELKLTPEQVDGFYTKPQPGEESSSMAGKLGLVICKAVIEHLGGTIGLTSSEAGTVFSLLLPKYPL